MSDITINAPITLPAAVAITAPVTIGYAGPAGANGSNGADGADGADGAAALADLTDVTTYDLATLNTPIANALAGKATTAQGTLADSAVQPNTSPTFTDLTASGLVAVGTGVANGLVFGDGDTGFVEQNDDDLRLYLSGTPRWQFLNNMIRSSSVGAGLNTSPSSVNPTLQPNWVDSNTGIGWSAADTLHIITGGVSALTVDSAQNVSVAGTIKSGPFTFATLPTPSTGMRTYITDSSVAASGNFGATVAAGGANTVPVFYDGTNWIIA